jgi:hypothetical protein
MTDDLDVQNGDCAANHGLVHQRKSPQVQLGKFSRCKTITPNGIQYHTRSPGIHVIAEVEWDYLKGAYLLHCTQVHGGDGGL